MNKFTVGSTVRIYAGFGEFDLGVVTEAQNARGFIPVRVTEVQSSFARQHCEVGQVILVNPSYLTVCK